MTTSTDMKPKDDASDKKDTIKNDPTDGNGAVSGVSPCSVIPKATGDNKAGGWTIDCSFIQKVRSRIEDINRPPAEEDIENVIVALTHMGLLKID